MKIYKKFKIVSISMLISALLGILFFVSVNIFIFIDRGIPSNIFTLSIDIVIKIIIIAVKSFLIIILYSTSLGLIVGITFIFVNNDNLVKNLIYAIIVGFLWGIIAEIITFGRIIVGLILLGICNSLLISIFIRNLLKLRNM